MRRPVKIFKLGTINYEKSKKRKKYIYSAYRCQLRDIESGTSESESESQPRGFSAATWFVDWRKERRLERSGRKKARIKSNDAVFCFRFLLNRKLYIYIFLLFSFS